MSLCYCNGPDFRGTALKILDSCRKIEEQQGVGVGVLQHVNSIRAEALSILASQPRAQRETR